MKTFASGTCSSRALLSLVFLLACGRLHASTRVWTGGGGNALWSNASNWSNGVPVAADGVQFGSNTSSTCDISPVINEIHFTGGGNTIAGSINLTGTGAANNVLNDAGQNTINAAIVTSGGATVYISVQDAAGLVSFGGIISGDNGVRIFGPGTVLYKQASNNSYTGATQVASGTLQLSSATAGALIPGDLIVGGILTGQAPGLAVVRLLAFQCISDGSNVNVGSDGVLDINSFNETVASLSGTGPILLGSGLLSVSGSVVTTYYGTISGTGGFTRSGTGTLTLVAPCGYQGTTTVVSGTLKLNCATTANAATTQNVVVGDGVGAASSAVLQLEHADQLPDGGTITVKVDGVLDLNGFDDVLGTVVFNGGTLDDGGATVHASTLIMNGGMITGAGALALSSTTHLTATSSSLSGAVISAPITLYTGVEILVNPGTVQPELALSGVISDAVVGGTHGWTKRGDGTLLMSNADINTYTGTTFMDRGTMTLNSAARAIVGLLVIGNDTDEPFAATVKELNNFDLQNGAPVEVRASGLLTLSTFSENIGALTGTGRVDAGGGPGVLTVGTGNVNSSFDGLIAGEGTLLKAGTGTLTLTGSNYVLGTVAFNVSSGTLRVMGHMDESVVTVGSAGKLAGDGSVGTVTCNTAGGNIDPGSPAIGTLTAAGTTFGSAGQLNIEMDDTVGQRSDRLTSSLLTLGGVKLALNITGTLSRSAYVIASYNNLSGSFGTLTGAAIPAGYVMNYAYNDGFTSTNIALALPQVAVTGAASNITGSGARFNGTIDPHGHATTYYFDYGPSSQYGSRTAQASGGSGSATIPVSTLVAGLNGGHGYHFRLVALNSTGSYFGNDAFFDTTGPIANTGGTSFISALSASLNGSVNPQSQATTCYFEYGLTSAYGLKTAVNPVGNGSVSVPVTAALTGLHFNSFYHYRLVATNVNGTSRGVDELLLTLNVLPPIIAAAGQPVPLISPVGAIATFSVTAVEGSPLPTDSPLTYQWNKNGAAIKGATSHNYTIAGLALTHAGAYTCTVKNASGTTLSGVAQLGVVDAGLKKVSVNQGTNATLTLSFAGNGLAVFWYKNNVITPVIGKTYSIQGAQPTDSAVYKCTVFAPGAVSLSTSGFMVSVYNGVPSILTPVTMPEGVVGGNYSFQIPVNPAPETAPASYSASGLPLGLSLNTTTGLISGRITAPLKVDTDYTVTMKATNAKGTTPAATATLLVRIFPFNIAGTYNSLVDRDPMPLPTDNLDGGLGGTCALAITSTGTYTGRLNLAGASYPLSGLFHAFVGSPDVSTTATIARAGLHTLQLDLSTDSIFGGIDGTVTDTVAGTSVAVHGDRNPWTTTTVSPRSGTFTTQIKIQVGGLVGNVAYPQGCGYATVTVTPAGVVTWVGKMADGTAPTATYATTLAVDTTFPLHLILDGNTGSIQGTVDLTPDFGTPVNNGQPLLSGTLDWIKNPQPPTSKDRAYTTGFDLFNLTLLGGKYVPPVGVPVLGLTPSSIPGTNNAQLQFTQGGLATAAQGPLLASRPLRITATNTTDFTNPTSNPTGLSLTINATTGAISGKFSLTDGGVPRANILYSGVLVPRTDVRAGVGYFLLPGLTPTTATSPILSGQVLLTP